MKTKDKESCQKGSPEADLKLLEGAVLKAPLKK